MGKIENGVNGVDAKRFKHNLQPGSRKRCSLVSSGLGRGISKSVKSVSMDDEVFRQGLEGALQIYQRKGPLTTREDLKKKCVEKPAFLQKIRTFGREIIKKAEASEKMLVDLNKQEAEASVRLKELREGTKVLVKEILAELASEKDQ